MRRASACVLALVLVWTTSSAWADTSVSPEKRAKILEILKVTHALDIGKQMGSQVTSMLLAGGESDPELRAKAAALGKAFLERMDFDTLIEPLVAIYARHFNGPELESLLVFYRSPAGQKMIAENPAIMRESMAAGENWGRVEGARVFPMLKDQFTDYAKLKKEVDARKQAN